MPARRLLTLPTRRLLTFLVCALWLPHLAACAPGGAGGSGQAPQTKGGAERPRSSDAPAPAASPAGEQSAGAERVFRGLIGGKYAVRVRLVRGAGGELTGSYSYEGRGGELTLKGSVDEKGNFTLDEYDGAKQTGTFKGQWREKDYEPEASLYGDWSKAGGGGEESFYLVEQRQQPGGPALTTKQIKEEDRKRGYSVSADYPQIEGAGGEKFNQLVQSFVTKEVGDFKRGAGRAPGEEDFAPDAAGDSLNLNYVVRLADAELVSVEFAMDYYAHGAAHPSHAFHVVNYDLKSGRQLSLADLFKPGSNYLKKISEVAVSQVRRWNKDSAQEPGGGGEPYLNDPGFEEGAAPKAENYRNWTLTTRGLVITFDYYQLGSYAAGAQTVVLPYADLKEVIRPDGPLARFVS